MTSPGSQGHSTGSGRASAPHHFTRFPTVRSVPASRGAASLALAKVGRAQARVNGSTHLLARCSARSPAISGARDEQPSRPAVAVISDRLCQQRLGRNPDAVGRSVTLGGSSYTIVGILPSRFELPDFDPLSGAGSLTARWTPSCRCAPISRTSAGSGSSTVPFVARLRARVTLEQARAKLDVLQQAVARTTHAKRKRPRRSAPRSRWSTNRSSAAPASGCCSCWVRSRRSC